MRLGFRFFHSLQNSSGKITVVCDRDSLINLKSILGAIPSSMFHFTKGTTMTLKSYIDVNSELSNTFLQPNLNGWLPIIRLEP